MRPAAEVGVIYALPGKVCHVSKLLLGTGINDDEGDEITGESATCRAFVWTGWPGRPLFLDIFCARNSDRRLVAAGAARGKRKCPVTRMPAASQITDGETAPVMRHHFAMRVSWRAQALCVIKPIAGGPGTIITSRPYVNAPPASVCRSVSVRNKWCEPSRNSRK